MSANDAFFLAVQTGECPLGEGWPGCAKTASTISFCKEVGRKLYVLIGSIREPSDFGIPFLDSSQIDHIAGQGKMEVDVQGKKKVAHFVLAAPKWAADTFDGNKHLILLDELTCCPPAVQAGMLRFIAENWVGDLELPSDIWKAALCNPTAIATNGFEIEPAMANRMCHLKWSMDWDAYDQGLANGFKFPAPSFPIVPNHWRDYLPQVGNMFRAFRSHKPDAFHPPLDANGNVSMDRSKMSGPWPSPRSWTIAAKLRAAGLAANVDRGVLLELLYGCVGHVANEYDEWETHLDLPDPSKMLADAVSAVAAGKKVPYKHPNRPDKVIALLGGIASHVMSNRSDKSKYNKERWEAALHIFEAASDHEKDVAISCCRQMFRTEGGEAGMPPGAKIPKSFQDKLFPIIKAALSN